MPRLFVIFAKTEPMAVIFRRGPTAWYHLIQWDTRRDRFIHGAWIKGRIYEEKCDLSPDGKFLVYSVYQGTRLRTKFTDSWTAVSRVPWLKALALWPQGMTYGGGGRFIDHQSLELRLMSISTLKEFSHIKKIRFIAGNPPYHHSTSEVTDADWCGRDQRGHIIYSKGGKLYRRKRGRDILLSDFTDMSPDPQPAPDWASQSY